MRKMCDWLNELGDSTGDFIRLETSDGIVREGKITGLRTRAIQFNNEQELMPTEVELNGDPNDTVALDRIIRLDIG